MGRDGKHGLRFNWNSPKNPFFWWLAWVPVLLFCLLALQGIGVYNASDDGEYLRWAKVFKQSVPLEERVPDQAAARVVLWLSTWFVSLFGPSIYWSSVVATFVFALATVVLLSFFWGRDYPPEVPILAATALATNRLFLFHSSMLYPEMFLSAFMLLAVVQYRKYREGNQRFWSWCFVGASIGLATLSKQPGALLFPLFVIDRTFGLASRKISLRSFFQSVLMMAFGGLVVFAISVAFMGWWFHRPFYFLDITLNTHEIFLQVSSYEENTSDRWVYLSYLNSGKFAKIGLLFLIAAIASCFDRKSPRLEAVIGLVFLGYLCAGSVSLTEYVRPTQRARYMIPCVPFFALCLGYQISRLLDLWKRFWSRGVLPHRWMIRAGWGCVILFFAVLAVFSFTMLKPKFTIDSQLLMIREAIADPDTPAFITKRFYKRYFPVLSAEELESLQILTEETPLPDRYTILEAQQDVHEAHMDRIPWQYARVIAPPSNWQPSFFRRLLDLLRKREHLAVAYTPPLYRIDVDLNGPRQSDDSRPWKRP